MEDPRRGGGLGDPLFGVFVVDFFTNKRQEMAILETQMFKNFWGSMPPDHPRKLGPSVLMMPPPPLEVLDLPLHTVHVVLVWNSKLNNHLFFLFFSLLTFFTIKQTLPPSKLEKVMIKTSTGCHINIHHKHIISSDTSECCVPQ